MLMGRCTGFHGVGGYVGDCESGGKGMKRRY